MAAPTIDELTAGIHRLSGDMQKSREGAEGMVDQFYNLLKTLIPIGAAVKGLSTLMGGIGSQYAFAARSIVASGRDIQQQRVAEAARLREMRAQLVTGEITLRQYRDARLFTRPRGMFTSLSLDWRMRLRLQVGAPWVLRRYYWALL